MSQKTEGQIKKEIVAAVEELGYEYIKDRKLTTHPSDWYLNVVLAKNNREYVVWLHNASLGGLHEGQYTSNKEIAEEHYNNK